MNPSDILGIYSDPNRDPRGHIMSIAFLAKIISGELKAEDDAENLKWVEISGLASIKIAFDHSKILTDYKTWLKNGGTYWSSK